MCSVKMWMAFWNICRTIRKDIAIYMVKQSPRRNGKWGTSLLSEKIKPTFCNKWKNMKTTNSQWLWMKIPNTEGEVDEHEQNQTGTNRVGKNLSGNGSYR